ncbi:MAG: hypothetical protein AAGA48_10490 [Myxococcota bacterium]
MLVWLGVAAALSQTPSDRSQIQRALIAEMQGDLPTAISHYQLLVRQLPDHDPLWAIAVVGWARLLYDEGRVSDAREQLRMATRKGRCGTDCQQLIQQIAIDQDAVRKVPVTWTFDNQNPGLFHHWSRQDLGELVAQPGALAWTTTADPRRPDRLVIGFNRPDPAPEVVSFDLRSRETAAWIRVVFEDESANRYSTPTIMIDPSEPKTVAVTLAEVVPEDPAKPLVPARLSRVSLEDLTGPRRPGVHTLEILELRVE